MTDNLKFTQEERLLINSELRMRNKSLLTAYVRLAMNFVYGFHRKYYNQDYAWLFPTLFFGGIFLRGFGSDTFLATIGMLFSFVHAILILYDAFMIRQWHDDYTKELRNEIEFAVLDYREQEKLSTLDRLEINDEVDQEVEHLEVAYAYADKLGMFYGFHRKYLNIARPWLFTVLNGVGFASVIGATTFIMMSLFEIISVYNTQAFDFLFYTLLSQMGPKIFFLILGLGLLIISKIILLIDKYKIGDLIMKKRSDLKYQKTKEYFARKEAEQDDLEDDEEDPEVIIPEVID